MTSFVCERNLAQIFPLVDEMWASLLSCQGGSCSPPSRDYVHVSSCGIPLMPVVWDLGGAMAATRVVTGALYYSVIEFYAVRCCNAEPIVHLDPPTIAAIGPSPAQKRAATSKNPTTCTLPSGVISHKVITPISHYGSTACVSDSRSDSAESGHLVGERARE